MNFKQKMVYGVGYGGMIGILTCAAFAMLTGIEKLVNKVK